MEAHLRSATPSFGGHSAEGAVDKFVCNSERVEIRRNEVKICVSGGDGQARLEGDLVLTRLNNRDFVHGHSKDNQILKGGESRYEVYS